MDNLSVVLKKPSAVYIGSNAIDGDRMDGAFYDNKYIENDIKLKKSGLRIESLSNVIETMNSPIGWQGIPSNSYLPHGIGTPLIRVQNVSDLILDEGSLIGVEDVIYEEQPAIQAQANDIIITRVGTIGRVCRIPEKISRIAMGQNLTRIKLKDSIIESGFALAYMSSEFCQLQMERYAYGGVQPSLTNKNIKQLLMPIPSHEIQKYIGDKVRKAEELREEANRLLNDIENMVSKLFEFCYKGGRKGNFVNNDILSEDRLDADYYSVENVEAKKRILQFSNLKKLKDIAYITDGDHGKPEFRDSGVLFIRNKNVRQYLINLDDVVYIDEAYENKYLKSSKLEFEDILLTKIGTIGECAVYTNNEGNLNANSALIRIKDKDFISPYYICAILNSSIYNTILNKESGGGVQAALSLSRLGEITVPILSRDVQIEIESMLKQYMRDKENTEKLIYESRQDIEDLIEGNFDMSKIKETN